MVFSTLIVCALSAPTEKSSESNTTDSLSQKKTILVNDEATSIVSIDSPHQNDKREKREDLPAPSSSENKRNTPVLSQPDYQENKVNVLNWAQSRLRNISIEEIQIRYKMICRLMFKYFL